MGRDTRLAAYLDCCALRIGKGNPWRCEDERKAKTQLEHQKIDCTGDQSIPVNAPLVGNGNVPEESSSNERSARGMQIAGMRGNNQDEDVEGSCRVLSVLATSSKNRPAHQELCQKLRGDSISYESAPEASCTHAHKKLPLPAGVTSSLARLPSPELSPRRLPRLLDVLCESPKAAQMYQIPSPDPRNAL
jgi:hypothetical protein